MWRQRSSSISLTGGAFIDPLGWYMLGSNVFAYLPVP
jgi:hypothetical protein